MRTRLVAIIGLAACLAGDARLAASSTETLVVSVAELAKQLGDPNLVLLHVGERAEYDRPHIPGARFVAVSQSGAARRWPSADNPVFVRS